MKSGINVRPALQRVLAGTLVFGVGASFVAVGSVGAQDDFPSETINVVTHAGPGGGTDITTRMMMLRGRSEFDQDLWS